MTLLKKPFLHLNEYLGDVFSQQYNESQLKDLKDLTITELDLPVLEEKPMYDMIKKMINKNTVPPKFKKIKRVYVDPHAWERWNERVGPSIKKNELIELIRTIFFDFPERISIESESSDLASIDNDIIFGFKIKNNSIKINTFYGRKSVNNLLNDIDSLRIFNKNQNDKIKLDVDKTVLNQMKKPLLPSKFIQFSIFKKDKQKKIIVKSFVFNVFSKKDNKVIPYIYYCYQYQGNTKSFKIKDYALSLKKMNKMPSEVLISLMLLNMCGSILMYLTKYHTENFSIKMKDILEKEQLLKEKTIA